MGLDVASNLQQKILTEVIDSLASRVKRCTIFGALAIETFFFERTETIFYRVVSSASTNKLGATHAPTDANRHFVQHVTPG